MDLLGSGAAFETPQWVLAAVATVACLISVYTDLKSRRILNVVTFPAIVIGLCAHLVFWGWSSGLGMGLKWSFIGLVAGVLPFLIFVSIDSRSFGMGDVKLAGALGALVGFPFILDVFLRLAIAGGVLAIVVLLWKGRLSRTLLSFVGRRRRPSDIEGGAPPEGYPSEDDRIYIPYGVAIAIGTIWAFAVELSRFGMGR